MQKIIQRREPGNNHALRVAALHPLLARVYSARGIDSAEALDLGLNQLLPPGQLRNAERAGVLLADALASELSILVVGDFDADGATSTALAVAALREFGAVSVDYLVPQSL